jgi:hypothetical protein
LAAKKMKKISWENYFYQFRKYLRLFILHSSFFIEFCEAKFLWASRFAPFGRSRRAIRSITCFTASPFRRWFRYYPSRKNALNYKK